MALIMLIGDQEVVGGLVREGLPFKFIGVGKAKATPGKLYE